MDTKNLQRLSTRDCAVDLLAYLFSILKLSLPKRSVALMETLYFQVCPVSNEKMNRSSTVVSTDKWRLLEADEITALLPLIFGTCSFCQALTMQASESLNYEKKRITESVTRLSDKFLQSFALWCLDNSRPQFSKPTSLNCDARFCRLLYTFGTTNIFERCSFQLLSSGAARRHPRRA